MLIQDFYKHQDAIISVSVPIWYREAVTSTPLIKVGFTKMGCVVEPHFSQRVTIRVLNPLCLMPPSVNFGVSYGGASVARGDNLRIW